MTIFKVNKGSFDPKKYGFIELWGIENVIDFIWTSSSIYMNIRIEDWYKNNNKNK